MSPFEDTTERVAGLIRGLRLRSQVALLASVADVLAVRYLDWCRASATADQLPLLRQALEDARGFAAESIDTLSPDLLASVETATPSEPSDAPWFTSAQDCWIVADSALRSARGDFDAPDAAWYLLEPMFQATSERLFGLSDVGSEDEEIAERQALEDPLLASAISALESAIRVLEASPRPISAALLIECREILAAVGP